MFAHNTCCAEKVPDGSAALYSPIFVRPRMALAIVTWSA